MRILPTTEAPRSRSNGSVDCTYELSYRPVALASLLYQMHDLLVLGIGTRITKDERRGLDGDF